MSNNYSEIIQRLHTAHEKTTVMFESIPIHRELHQGTEIANYWPCITAAYSGLEQTLKYLLAIQKSYSIEKLLENKDYMTHDLFSLFKELEDSTKNKLDEYYKQFQSLYSYIDILTLEDFFEVISGTKGNGYVSWRYSLIECKKNLPITSVEGMLSIWGFCLEICEFKIFKRFPPRLIDKKLENYFRSLFISVYQISAIRSQENGKPFVDYSTELTNEYQKHGGLLNFLAQELSSFGKYELQNVNYRSEELSEIIKGWINNIIERKKIWGLSSKWLFVHKAMGKIPNIKSIRLNQETKLFEDIPC